MASRLAISQTVRPAAAAAVRRQPLVLARMAGSGPHWNEPSGHLFGEKPLAPGQKRKKESWENLWYVGMIGGTALAVVLYQYRPENDVGVWAEKEARKRLDERGEWRYKPSTTS